MDWKLVFGSVALCMSLEHLTASQRTECSRGYWGKDCTNRCVVGCSNTGCDKISGICFGCNTGYQGYQGKFCDNPCPIHCLFCNQYSTECLSCPSGFYGNTCKLQCPTECRSLSCFLKSGDCYGCKSGWFGPKCNKQCGINCYNGCHKHSGTCQYCNTGFWGSNCSNACPQNCEVCDISDGDCLICLSGFWGRTCSNICRSDNCKLCDKNTGICKTCREVLWGPNCKLRCSNNCTNNECDNSTGTCSTCPAGFAGNNCNIKCDISTCSDWYCDKHLGFRCSSCKMGFWGDICQNKCMNNGRCVNCDKATGLCNTCATEYWGNSCERECPINCKGKCNRDTGVCNYICDDQVFCYSRATCKSGFWGLKCENKCMDENCDTCDRINNGVCSKCRAGYWGPSCQNKCTFERCLECHVYEGFCTMCNAGFWGKSCHQRCHKGCSCCDAMSGICKQENCLRINDLRNVTGTSPGAHLKEESNDETLIIVGIALIGCSGVVLLSAFLLFLWMRRRIQQKAAKPNYQNVEKQTVSYKVDQKGRDKGNESLVETDNSIKENTHSYGVLNVGAEDVEPDYEYLQD